MSAVLVVNSGSSSLKYQLIEMAGERVLATGLIERIGEATGLAAHKNLEYEPAEFRRDDERIADHAAAFNLMLANFAEHGPNLAEHPVIAVGHRVVHGGKRFFEATVVTDLVKINIQDLAELAPLHNPANLEGIEAAQVAFPGVPHVVVFDTAFHATLPPEAYSYAIDATLAARYRIRRYGFHGTSHKYVSERAAEFLGSAPEQLNQIILHLGNGASATAIRAGKSVDTSMGFTPLEGLVMGTRSGDIDPAIIVHLERVGGFSYADIDTMLNRKSGLLGLSGVADMRDLQERAEAGDAVSTAALGVYLHRLRGYIGNYYVNLGHVDSIVFTGGVGENSALVRSRALAGLGRLGIEIDEELNELRGSEPRLISTPQSEVAVLVVPTNEELEIARQTLGAIEG
ncbi:acetate/propionate family kinase [Mycetocola spongiae]|uniref:acetate/propionate family kinase n=1 Tax=Mycetocola spongiae TaxID=2859226 RepID=UPI001CF57A7B|nr:acetate kinase [Mycetocola spongiae]UCR87881.1 acetate kinase [Mycetocola spongiae]